MLAFFKKHKKLLLFLGIFISLFTGAFLQSSTQAWDGGGAPTVSRNVKQKIVTSGGWVSDIIIAKNGNYESYQKSGQDYDASKKEIYFNEVGTSNLYVSNFPDFFNTNADPYCLPAFKVTEGTPTTVTVSGVVNEHLNWDAADAQGVDKPTNAQCATKMQKYNRWSGEFTITGVIQGGDIVDGFLGFEILPCKEGDSACIATRNKNINSANNAIKCTTTSAQAIKQCSDKKAIIKCLQDDVTKSVSDCSDIYTATDILNGNTESISANTSDKRIQAICGTLSSASEKAKCISNAEKARLDKQCQADPTKEGCAGTDQSSTCVIENIGWIVCGMANFIGNVADGIYSLIESILKVPVINTNIGDGTNGVYNTWSVMRTLANVAFVIGFLIIIFSQLTSLGITNYGIKKTLPRLVVAAILVNISFWISAIAVDLSNILGAGLYDLLNNIKNNMNIDIGQGSNWANILTALLSGSAIAISGGVVVAAAGIALSSLPGIGLALLFLALPVVLGALLAIFIVIFVLIARQALVIILIIISPLAFVALLLPNTEKLFTKWRQTLMSLLLMYPIISIIFGGAQIAGLAIMSTAANYSSSISTANAMAVGMAIIVGQIVMVIPFFFLPFLLTKFSGGNLDSIAANIQNRGKSLINGIGGASRKYGMKALGRSWGRTKYGDNVTPQYNSKGQETWRSRMRLGARGLGRSLDQRLGQDDLTDKYLAEQKSSALTERLANDQAYALGAAGGSASGAERLRAAAEAEELKKALQPLMRELASMSPGQKSAHINNEIAAGGSRAAAALHYSASIGDTGTIRTHSNSADANIRRMAQEAIGANAAAILPKAPDLVKGADAAFKSVKAGDIATFDDKTAAEFVRYLSTMPPGPAKDAAHEAVDTALGVIQKSADLQSKFGAETAKVLRAGGLDRNSLITPEGGLVP